MTREEFGPIVLYLSSAVNREIPREQAEVYYDLLGDLPAAAVRAAVRRAFLESAYPTVPPVGTLRRLAILAMHPRETATQNVARIARERLESRGHADPEAVRALLAGKLHRNGAAED